MIIGERSGTLTVRQGKGNKQRAVPLSQTVRQALWNWLVAAEGLAIPNVKRWSKAHADHLMTWIAAHPLRPLFSSQKGGRLKERTIQTMVQDAARRAGLVDVSPHTLRHTCAFQLLKAGATLVEVAQILGHTSISTTQIYTGSTEQHLQAAVDRIGWD
jgi:site-specific recombinase XerD